mmetsp:Transcript_59369/g.137122  ORF Transcript_59369/g.137122 Transcript_59369/m.137122 type:complete len:644 (+) Transcript_59369:947-2878(+)
MLSVQAHSRMSSDGLRTLRSVSSTCFSQTLSATSTGHVAADDTEPDHALWSSALECLSLHGVFHGVSCYAALQGGQQCTVNTRMLGSQVAVVGSHEAVVPRNEGALALILDGEVSESGQRCGLGHVLYSRDGRQNELGRHGPVTVLRATARSLAEAVAATSPPVLSALLREHHLEGLSVPNAHVSLLARSFVFRELGNQDLYVLALNSQMKSFLAGECILAAGTKVPDFLLIVAGRVHSYRGQRLQATHVANDFLGGPAVVQQGVDVLDSYVADEAVDCLVIAQFAVQTVLPRCGRDFVRRLQLQDLCVRSEDLEIISVLGRGSFGTVSLARHRDNPDLKFAVKKISTAKLKVDALELLEVEREVLTQCHHPCVVGLQACFRDAVSVTFVMDHMGGGDLFEAIRAIGLLSRLQSQYYTAAIALALQYLHSNGIMYRDLKPDNVMLSERGYPKLVDMGCCSRKIRSNTVVGTPEYMAPEMVTGKGYTMAVDWWALGVCAYEFLCGPQPFGAQAESKMELFRDISEAPLVFPGFLEDVAARSLLQGLLCRSVGLRLGPAAGGLTPISEHVFFEGFSFASVLDGTCPPPWNPPAAADRPPVVLTTPSASSSSSSSSGVSVITLELSSQNVARNQKPQVRKKVMEAF